MNIHAAAFCCLKKIRTAVNRRPRRGVSVYRREGRRRALTLDFYIQQYGRRLYGLCLTLCGSVHDAEDLYQETWLRALAHLEQYDPERPFEPWLTKICVNFYRSGLRRLARSPIFDGFSTDEEKDALFASLPAPEESDHADLRAAVDALPERLRLTVILYYFQDLDIASAAEILKVPPGTVKSRLNKARKLLKEALQND